MIPLQILDHYLQPITIATCILVSDSTYKSGGDVQAILLGHLELLQLLIIECGQLRWRYDRASLFHDHLLQAGTVHFNTQQEDMHTYNTTVTYITACNDHTKREKDTENL